MSSCLLIATSNAGKVAEIREFVAGLDYEVLSVLDLRPVPPAPAEIAETFAGNALLKARYYRGLSGHLTLADDSGLVVDALGGAPGVHSARYGGPAAAPSDLINKLLAELSQVSQADRAARFISVIALAGPGLERVFEGKCEGLITFEPRGTGGFGYDPVFLLPELGRTLAEMTLAEKSRCSHRGRALLSARKFLIALKNLELRST